MPTAATWKHRDPAPEQVAELARRRALPEMLARMLVNRGHTDPEQVEVHLAASPQGLHDPELLPGMQAATERLQRALEQEETVLVHGDYDVDGVTGTTLLVRLFRALGGKVEWHIPNRLTDGYSFGEHSIARAQATGASVVISVDNGTSAFDTIAALKERGVDTVVTDHHEPPPAHPLHGALPPAVAIVNPKLAESTYPFPELCGGAVAFKLAWGLCQRLSDSARVRPDLKRFLEDCMAYVAIATVCDVVPLLGENRIFARWGLKAMEGTRNAGLRALLDVCSLGDRALGAEDVGFQIGPRINASGRLGSAERAVACLLADDPTEAREHAEALDELNQRRKQIEKQVHAQAREAARAYADAARWPVLVLAGQGWHQGVVGIVAARLSEEYARPSVIIGLDGEEGRGSARSVAGFSVLAALEGGAEHALRWGGHAQAAGMEIRADKLDDYREAVCARARELLGGESYPPPELAIDGELPLQTLDAEFMRQLERLEPFGERNQKPLFLASDVRLAESPRAVGQEGAHLLLRLTRGAADFRAMAFGQGARIGELELGRPLDVVYTPRWNTFRGRTNLELQVLDFRVGS